MALSHAIGSKSATDVFRNLCTVSNLASGPGISNMEEAVLILLLICSLKDPDSWLEALLHSVTN